MATAISVFPQRRLIRLNLVGCSVGIVIVVMRARAHLRQAADHLYEGHNRRVRIARQLRRQHLTEQRHKRAGVSDCLLLKVADNSFRAAGL
jgi:hypothetical protein